MYSRTSIIYIRFDLKKKRKYKEKDEEHEKRKKKEKNKEKQGNQVKTRVSIRTNDLFFIFFFCISNKCHLPMLKP